MVIDWAMVRAIAAVLLLLGALFMYVRRRAQQETKLYDSVMALNKTVEKQGETLGRLEEGMSKIVLILERQEQMRKDIDAIWIALEKKVDVELCNARHKGEEK